jgi:hypothetical protein
VCDVIARLEDHGIDLEQMEHVLKKRPGRPPGPLSETSISLLVLGVVEDEWRRLRTAETSG